MNPPAAFPVTDPSEVAEPRRVVQRLAASIGFPEARAGQAALVVTELATNLAKHARGGEIVLRAVTDGAGEPTGIEVLALDKGPGLSDPAQVRRDGYSTAGTLGHGLGAIERQSDVLDVYTHTSGTAIAATLWRDRAPTRTGEAPVAVGAVHVAKRDEPVCGDAWAWRWRPGRLSVFVADGLGHGLLACEAAEAAVRVFARDPESAPATLVADVHTALRATRGAAVAHLAVDLTRETGVFAGLGNITGVILADAGRRTLVSHNGTAGRTAARIQEFSYPVPSDSLLILFSDGLGSGWDLGAYPGLLSRSPALIAGILYRDYSRRRDDTTVVVLRPRLPGDISASPFARGG
jgi:anti-sigma regulatory factor (Ser/Thr protein kinase)